MQDAHRKQGFTLIEILIALVVMGVGMLGLATLQSTALKHGVDIAAQTRMTYLAASIAERMQANPRAAGDYVTAMTAQACGDAPYNCGDSATGDGDFCSARQTAAFDVWDVFCRHTGRLPGEPVNPLHLQTLNISCTDTPCQRTAAYIIDISWQASLVDKRRSLNQSANTGRERHIHLVVRPR